MSNTKEYFDELNLNLEQELNITHSKLEILNYKRKVLEIFQSTKSVFHVEGENKNYLISNEKLDIPDFNSFLAGMAEEKSGYKTFPSQVYLKRLVAQANHKFGQLYIGRQVAQLGTFPYTILIDDADVLINAESKPFQTNKIYTLNKDCRNYLDVLDTTDQKVIGTFSFMKSLNKKSSKNTPDWFLNYLIMQ